MSVEVKHEWMVQGQWGTAKFIHIYQSDGRIESCYENEVLLLRF